MEFGLVGKDVSKSISKIIHSYLPSFNYELISLPSKQSFIDFLESDFKGLNVTIPYKIDAFNRCDYVEDKAKELGVVNTLVKKDNKIYGYNTDIDGFFYLLEKNNIDVSNKNCLILGTGASSRTVAYCLTQLHAKSIKYCSRNPNEINCYSYEESSLGKNVEIIINTTPLKDKCLLNLDNYKSLEWFIDINYKPFRSTYLIEAYKHHIKYVNGLQMLVCQAVYSAGYFTSIQYNQAKVDEIYEKVKLFTQNIVLIGPPCCGKTSIGKFLAEKTKKKFIDLDLYIEAKTNNTIEQLFEQKGEQFFRELEEESLKEICSLNEPMILSAGGGTLIRPINRYLLLSMGTLVHINRPLDLINEDDLKGRPLIKTKNDLVRLIKERTVLYLIADIHLTNNRTIEELVKEIIEQI